MTKLKLRIKTAATEVEYEREHSFLNAEMPKLLEIITKSDNTQPKAILLEAMNGLQQCMDELEGIYQNVSVCLDKFKELSQSQYMQEVTQSFNLQYLGLQNQMQDENRRFTLVSNIMKIKHETAKNVINNLR
jgi:hypothetical protein